MGDSADIRLREKLMSSHSAHERIDAPAPVQPESRPSLRVELISDLSELGRYAEAWDNLALYAAQKTPMISHAWVASHIEHQLPPNASWVCLCAFESDELVGVLPLVARHARVLGISRTLLDPPCSLHTRSVEPVVREDRSEEIVRALLAALPRAVPDWHSVEFTRIPDTSSLLKSLSGRITDAKCLVDFNGNGSLLTLSGKYDEYMNSLSKNFRRNLRRLSGKIELLSDFEVIFLSSEQARSEHLDWFAEVEASGWKGDQGTAIGKSPDLMSFYAALVQRMAARGWLEWHFLKAEGKVIAAFLGARLQRRLVLLKIAYRDEYSSFAPGNILLNRLIERTYQHGDLDVIDCMTEMSWNQNWNMLPNRYFDIHLFRNSIISKLGAYYPGKLKETARGIAPIYSTFRRIKKLFASNEK
jgi:CelD/BcsL family acetyltransferase involved in cellulose biosynthesis